MIPMADAPAFRVRISAQLDQALAPIEAVNNGPYWR